MVKEKSKLLKILQQIFKIGASVQRFAGFMLGFFILIHIASCFWIMTANFTPDKEEGSWMDGEVSEMSPGRQYLIAFYFTVTTITTVGYGDLSGGSANE